MPRVAPVAVALVAGTRAASPPGFDLSTTGLLPDSSPSAPSAQLTPSSSNFHSTSAQALAAKQLQSKDASPWPIQVALITGAGRSGTHSIAHYLDSNGVPTLHETAMEGKVSVGWPYAGAEYTKEGEVLWERPWHDDPRGPLFDQDGSLRKRGIRFQPVVHLVREPLTHIGSIAGCLCPGNWFNETGGARPDNKSWTYAKQVLSAAYNNNSLTVKFLEEDPTWRVRYAAAYWLEWNQLAARYATARHNMEALDGQQLLADLGKPGTLPPFDVHNGAAKDNPEHEGVPNAQLSWSRLRDKVGDELTAQIRQAAEAWGYSYTKQGRLWKIGTVVVNRTDEAQHPRWAVLSATVRPVGFGPLPPG